MATGAPAAGSLWQGVLGHALAHAWVALGMVTRVPTMLMAAFTNISPLSAGPSPLSRFRHRCWYPGDPLSRYISSPQDASSVWQSFTLAIQASLGST